MFEILPKSNEEALAIKASGKLSADDYEKVLIPKLNELFKAHKRVRLMVEFSDDFACWSSAEAAWDDAKIGLEHPNDFEKIALVGAPAWIKLGMKFYCLFFRGEVKAFAGDAEAEAWDWVKA
ncbi:MAG: STAS/SEC14 domain-containing protein [Alphaproteobacteria bacterium]|nr:STAS/SEC14 domain-containing protein [Alphaproteobacteria bacterium]